MKFKTLGRGLRLQDVVDDSFFQILVDVCGIDLLHTASFCEDILTSPLLQDQAVELNALVDQYDNVLRSLSDPYAPLKRRTVTLRPSAPRYKAVRAEVAFD